MNSKNIMWGAGIVVAVLVGLWGIWKITTVPAGSDEAVQIEVTESDNIRGPENAAVTLVEYSDLQCPACAAYAPLVKQVLENNPDTVRLVYKHFPLQQHQFATDASYAAEAAGKQGAFFEYHDILFERQESWSTGEDLEATFISYAEELDLDIDQFKADMASQEVKDKVEADKLSGAAAGVDATPSFYLNGSKIRNPQSLEAFQALIDAEIEALGESDEATEATDEESSDDAMMDESTEEGSDESMMEDEAMEEGAENSSDTSNVGEEEAPEAESPSESSE